QVRGRRLELVALLGGERLEPADQVVRECERVAQAQEIRGGHVGAGEGAQRAGPGRPVLLPRLVLREQRRYERECAGQHESCSDRLPHRGTSRDGAATGSPGAALLRLGATPVSGGRCMTASFG